MNKLLLALILLINTLIAKAENIPAKEISTSPFIWSVRIGSNEFKNVEINKLLKEGIELKDQKVKFKFEFETEWAIEEFSKKEKIKVYYERLWLTGLFGSTPVGFSAVGCFDYKEKAPQLNDLSFTVGSTSIRISCISPK